MKKFLSIFLAMLFIFSTMAMSVSAASIEKDENNIAHTDFLDFTPDTNQYWAKETDGKWECFIEANSYCPPENDDGEVIAPYIVPYASHNKNTTWSLTDGGEVLHFEVTGENTHPGLSFMLDEYHDDTLPVGMESESTPKAEYVKIRVRNSSTASKFTFGYTAGHTNQYKFMGRTLADLKVDMNGKKYKAACGDWETYIFSYAEINAATNYNELLKVDPVTGKPLHAWSGCVAEFLIFPFGYDVTDGTGAYPGASIDIDYIVIGSKEYVTNYKSDLEIKEESITSLELIKEPTKKTYYVGETLDLTGLELKATYADGTSEILTGASYHANLETQSDSTPVTLKFGSKSVTYPIKVIGVSSIEVLEEPESKLYEVGAVADGFVPEGFKFKVNYTDGKSNDALPNSMFHCIADDLKTPGTKNVTANFYRVATTFSIDVINVTDIEITQPEGNLFRYRDTPTEADFNIQYVYNDGTKKEKKDAKTELEFTFEGTVKSPDGSKVTVKAVNEKIGLEIVKEVPLTVEMPAEMALSNDPIKKVYAPGESFDPAGLIVDFVYADGTRVQLNDEDYKVRADLSTPGTAKVSIRSNVDGVDLKTSLDVTVEGTATTETQTPGETEPDTEPEASSGSSTTVIIIVVVAVVVIAAVVVIVLLTKKKKK